VSRLAGRVTRPSGVSMRAFIGAACVSRDVPGQEDARVAIGQTRGGRYLRIIYVPDPEPDSVFVITGYDLGPKAVRALRRRLKSKP